MNIRQFFFLEHAFQEKEFIISTYSNEIHYIYNISVFLLIYIVGKYWELL